MPLWAGNKKLWKLWRWEMVIVPKKLQHFFAINSHIFIRTIVLLLTLSFFTASSARMGSQTLAINTILLQFFMFFTYFIDGFANAAEALVGKYIGAFKSPQDLKKLIRTLFLWAFGLSIPFAIGYLFFGEYIIILLTDIPSIMQGAKSYFIWIGLMPLLSFAAFIWDGVFIGATKTSAMRNSMLVSSFLIFFPLYFIFQPIWGNHGLWLAFNAFLLSRGLFLHVQAKKQLFNHSN
ncbi:MAG: hypothetical protein B7C24_03780 [Bacteroidetes bacterium 4572_77]|nr:MAG: hypothetical protein B7C24_03780 [Bacteroidetes bacterium 4572_77]